MFVINETMLTVLEGCVIDVVIMIKNLRENAVTRQ
jgi:hypothetical protein